MIKIIFKPLTKFMGDRSVKRYYLFIFFKDFAFFSAVLVPFFTQWGHISLTQVQILQSWFMLWWFLLEIPTGTIADYLGKKHSLVLGALTIAVAAIIYGSVPKFEIFLLGEFLFALGNALISGADSAFLYESLKEQKRESESKRVYGKAFSIYLLGILISAPLGSVIAAKFGLNAPMFASAIPAIIAAFIGISMKEPVTTERNTKANYLIIIKDGLNFFRHHKFLWLITLDGIVVASAAYFVIWLYQPFLTKLSVPIAYFGLFHAFLVGTEIVVAYGFIKLEKIFGSAKSFLSFTAGITAVAFLIVATIPHLLTVILLLLLGGGFGLTRLEYLEAIMNKSIPSAQRATVLSTISMLRQFFLVILNPIIGFTADHSLRLAALVVGVLPLVLFFFSPLEKEMLE